VSCASAGSCTASGYYVSRDGDWRVFAAGERHGRWSPATEVAGVTALSPDRYVQVTSLSCAPAGNCAAGGSYIARNDTGQGFVAVEKNGRWGKTTGVPGLAALNAGGAAQVSSVSCAAAGSCAAGGYYRTNSGQRAFVADERDGRWGKATALPGLAALDTDELSEVTSVSCSSAGSCAAGGDYLSILHGSQPFVAGERHGRWGKAIQLPGLAALNDGGAGEVTSVSCASPGNCTAGGYLGDRGGLQGFVAGERHGRWGTAILIPGLAALNKAGAAEVTSVSCSSAGNCAAGGFVAVSYAGGDDLDQGFVATERHGSWSKAIEVPGLAALNTDKDAQVWSVSCAPAGNCAAGGSYTDRHGQDQGFVASERHGLWSIAIKIPGEAPSTAPTSGNGSRPGTTRPKHQPNRGPAARSPRHRLTPPSPRPHGPALAGADHCHAPQLRCQQADARGRLDLALLKQSSQPAATCATAPPATTAPSAARHRSTC
jgi:hypothetical protein